MRLSCTLLTATSEACRLAGSSWGVVSNSRLIPACEVGLGACCASSTAQLAVVASILITALRRHRGLRQHNDGAGGRPGNRVHTLYPDAFRFLALFFRATIPTWRARTTCRPSRCLAGSMAPCLWDRSFRRVVFAPGLIAPIAFSWCDFYRVLALEQFNPFLGPRPFLYLGALSCLGTN